MKHKLHQIYVIFQQKKTKRERGKPILRRRDKPVLGGGQLGIDIFDSLETMPFSAT